MYSDDRCGRKLHGRAVGLVLKDERVICMVGSISDRDHIAA